MNPSKLRHRVKLHRKISSRSPTGAVKVAQWEHVLTLWAEFTPMSVKDVINAQAVQTNITARAKIRYRTDVDSAMRLEHAGRMYEIVGEPLADNASGREYLTLVLKNI